MNEDLTWAVDLDVLSGKIFGTRSHVSVNDQKVCTRLHREQFIINILLDSSHQGPRTMSHPHSQCLPYSSCISQTDYRLLVGSEVEDLSRRVRSSCPQVPNIQYDPSSTHRSVSIAFTELPMRRLPN